MGHAVATGKYVEGFYSMLTNSRDELALFEKSDAFKSISESYNRDYAAFDYFRTKFKMGQGGAYHHTSMDAVDPMFDAETAGTTKALQESIPDFEGRGLMGQLGHVAKESVKESGVGAALNPFNNMGVPRYLTSNPDLVGKPRTSTQFIQGRLAEEAGNYTDNVTRATAVIDQMRRGESMPRSVDRAKNTLVDYDPRRFTKFENDIMKRVFPFYSFLSSQIPYVLKELMRHPAGGLGMTIRAQRLGQDDKYVPFHMRDKAAIPLGPDEDGNQSYIGSLGLMHEDAVGMLNPDLADIFGNMNPLLKAPVELATGRSLFMRGPLGGRDLSELDPAMGRIRQSIGERTGLLDESDQRPKPVGSATFEHLVSNSPVSRLVNTAKTLLDDRKPFIQRAVNLLAGPKFTTITPQSEQGMMRAELDAIAKEEHVRPFVRYSLGKGDIQALEDSGDVNKARKFRAINKVRALMDKAQKERNKDGKK